MRFLLSLIDLSGALNKTLQWARTQRGHDAVVGGILRLILCIPFGWLCWYFDVESTIIFTNQLGNKMLATASESVLVYAQLILLLFAAAPTLIRQTLSPVAAQGATVAGIMVYIVGAFDGATDWPRTRDFFDSIWYIFEPLGMFSWPVWYTCRVVWMFMATDGFEILFITTLVCGVLMLRNGLRELKKATA